MSRPARFRPLATADRALLEEATIRAATERGARVLRSFVHVDNDAMIALNASCGAAIRPLSDDPDHVVCLIRLPRPL